MAQDDVIVGIDLGTTNSLVAWADASGPRVLAGEGEDPIVPSVVALDAEGRAVSVGAEAGHEQAAIVVRSVKRLMGRSASDVESIASMLGYEVVEGEHETARIRLPGTDQLISPQEVSAQILTALAERARRVLGKPVRKAVVTVPAYFDDAQRQATRDAGRIAGLEVVRIVNEPTAAALAYGIGVGHKAKDAAPETIAVYDLGGGTFDISILRVVPGDEAEESFFQVLATSGDTQLGGDDFDQALAEYIAEQAGASLEEMEASEREHLRRLASRAKIQLSEDPETAVALSKAIGGGSVTVTREAFERAIEPLVERTVEITKRALTRAKLRVDAVDRAILVGGSTRVPLVRRRVGEVFGRPPYTALDPDRVVALGAAVQASILAGTTTDMLLFDVIPLSLGLETAGGAVAKIVTSGSSVPARAKEMFSTSVDGQTSIKLHVLQGEREMVSDCRSLGEFHLRGIPPMPAGIPQLEVEFLVDANGVLNVSAIEKRSDTRAQIQIVPNHGLTREEVERMEREALEHAREDMTRHRVADLIVNTKLDLKWIEDRLRAFDEDEPSGKRFAEVGELVAQAKAMVAQAEADWRSVDADAFYALKQRLDEASVPLHEASITRSLRGD